MPRMRPLTGAAAEVQESATRAFCATLPSEREFRAAAKAFCATLPSESGTEEQMVRAFCATLPSESAVRTAIREHFEAPEETE